MKNNYFLLLCFFFCTVMQAQIIDLQKLSKGRLYSSEEIKDENNNVRGYFLLFENDKIAKETFQLEYIVLDENLTKVTNGLITEMMYESWLLDSKKIKVRASFYNNKLLLQFSDIINDGEYFRRYRLLDIKTNDLSKPFVYIKGKMKLDPVFDRKNSNISNNDSEDIHLLEGVGLVVNSERLDKKENLNHKFLARFDENFNEVWRFNYNSENDKRYKGLTYVKSDEEVIVMSVRCNRKGMNRLYVNEPSMLFIDAKKGTLRKEYVFPDLDKLSYRVVDCKITEDKIYLGGNYSELNKTGFISDVDNLGLFNLVFDKATGKLLNSHYLKWEFLKGKLPIDKKGYVKKEGYLFPHKMLFTPDGKIIVVTEAFIQSPITTNNMYFFEFTENLKLNQFFVVEKFRNKFSGTSAHSSDIQSYGLFDFIDYQDLGDGEYLFLINDNEKKSKNRKNSTLYGIISYSDGAFKRQTLELKTETSTKYVLNAKKGYVLIVEHFDQKNKSSEYRLEKINY